LILIILIVIYYVFYFLVIGNFDSWFLQVCPLHITWSYESSLEFQKLAWFDFDFFMFYIFFKKKEKFNFIFDIRLLGLQLCDFCCFFFFIGLSQSHILSRELVELTPVDSSFCNWFYFHFHLSFFSLLESWPSLLFVFFSTWLSQLHKWPASLACWLELDFLFFKKINFFFQFILFDLLVIKL
jgi:hypothetical protein